MNDYYASCSDESDLDSMNGLQKAYANAYSCDDIEHIENSTSVLQNIQFCIGFNEIVGFDFLNLFRNIEIIGSKQIDGAMFDSLRQLFNFHDQLKDAFLDVVRASEVDHSAFEEALAQFG